MKLSKKAVSVRLAARNADLEKIIRKFKSISDLFDKLNQYSRIMAELDKLLQNWEEFRSFYKVVDTMLDKKSDMQEIEKALERLSDKLKEKE